MKYRYRLILEMAWGEEYGNEESDRVAFWKIGGKEGWTVGRDLVRSIKESYLKSKAWAEQNE